MNHINFNNIGKICYGRGSFNQLGEILQPKRNENEAFMVFLVDDYFEGKELSKYLPMESNDMVYFIDGSHEEPKTSQIDELRDEILSTKGLPAGIVGIGGGSIMDIAKALALMVTNEGSSVLYQGLNLIKKPGIYHVGVPTISGTGPNGAIIHYKADKQSNRLLKKGDVYLVDSGGQYLYGTTDVTRTLSLH